MLLKACLVQRQINIQDPQKGHSVGFKKCLNLARQHCGFTESKAGVFRAIDSLRDGEQHSYITIPEDVLFLHARGLVTAIDEVLEREFKERLADHLPTRSSSPCRPCRKRNLRYLSIANASSLSSYLPLDAVSETRRAGASRTLLSMEAHVADEVEISEKDITRVEKALKGDKPWVDVLPRLKTMQTNMIGTSVDLKVHITKSRNSDPQDRGGRSDERRRRTPKSICGKNTDTLRSN